MAWDMICLLISKLSDESSVSRLPFGSLCCTMRATVTITETAEIEPGIDDVEMMLVLPVLRKFADRWKIGRESLLNSSLPYKANNWKTITVSK